MNDESPKGRRLVPSLPKTPAEWDAARAIKHERTLNDHVEDIHLAISANEKLHSKYERLLDAVYDEDAVEGSLSTDNILAATMIRDFASEGAEITEDEDDGSRHVGPGARDHYVATKKLATLVKSLNVVLRRYKNSRAERARRVGDDIVGGESNGA